MEIFNHIHIGVWILQTIAMMITALLIPGFTVSGPIGALIGVVGIAFVNAHLWDTALFFSVPDSFSVHAFTVLVANGVIFWILVKILPGIEVRGILPSIAAPVVFSITGILLNHYAANVDWMKVWNKTSAYVRSVKEDLKEEAPHKTITPSPRN